MDQRRVIFAILLMVYRSKNALREGFVTGCYFIMVFAARFALEFFKTPQASYEEGLSIHVGQYLSLPFVVLGLGLLAYAMSSRKELASDSSPDAEGAAK